MTGWLLKFEDRWAVLTMNGWLMDLDNDDYWVEQYEWEAAEEVEYDVMLIKTSKDHLKLVAKLKIQNP
jgi:hypothetical protein